MSTHELDLFDHVAWVASTMPERAFTKPDDDWAPIAFLQGEDGMATLPIEQFMENARSKDLLADFILPAAIEKFQAKKLVMVLSVWGTTLGPGEELGDLAPSQHPKRKEFIMLIEYTAEGVTRTSQADIIRHEDAPPTLGDWESEHHLASEGRFIGPIVAAMKRVR